MRPALFSLALACLALTSCSEWMSELGKAGPCAHVVLVPTVYDLKLAQHYRPGATQDHLTRAEGKSVARNLPAAVENYVRDCERKGTGFFLMDRVPPMLRAGEYHLQMVPIRAGGRRLVMINLITVTHGQGRWRKQWVDINDGGINNCRCLIDPATNEVLHMDSNGYA